MAVVCTAYIQDNYLAVVYTACIQDNYLTVVYTNYIQSDYLVVVRYHCGGWSEEVNSCILISYMVYL
jgi:hypothetical protein